MTNKLELFLDSAIKVTEPVQALHVFLLAVRERMEILEDEGAQKRVLLELSRHIVGNWPVVDCDVYQTPHGSVKLPSELVQSLKDSYSEAGELVTPLSGKTEMEELRNSVKEMRAQLDVVRQALERHIGLGKNGPAS